MAMNFFLEWILNDNFLNIRKFIYLTLNNSDFPTFFLIVFRSRIKEKNQVEGGDNRECGIIFMEEEGF